MGAYKVSSQYICAGEPYDISAVVTAYNEGSAKAQLDWLMANKHCMCQECIAQYNMDYSTHIVLPSGMPVYNMCILCICIYLF